MGPGAYETTTGKALIRGLRRSIRDMPESELRVNLEEIRDKINTALTAADALPLVDPIQLPDLDEVIL